MVVEGYLTGARGEWMMSCNSSRTSAHSNLLMEHDVMVMDGMLSVFTEKHKGVAGSALHLDEQLVMVLEIVTQVLDWFEEGNYSICISEV